MIRIVLAAALSLLAGGATAAQEPASPLNTRLEGAITPVHDPVIIRAGDTYYVYGTGLGP
jgi:arabinan endo-1,5-alpha-L-arabinosidase